MADLITRLYAAPDHAACMALFDSNVPRDFAPAERPDFAGFLDGLPDNPACYLVLCLDGAVVACGGLVLKAHAAEARLSWGRVARDRHRMGLGRQLLQTRLDIARATPGLDSVAIETTPLSAGFYARFGFGVCGITPDGFGPGLDRWDMRLTLR